MSSKALAIGCCLFAAAVTGLMSKPLIACAFLACGAVIASLTMQEQSDSQPAKSSADHDTPSVSVTAPGSPLHVRSLKQFTPTNPYDSGATLDGGVPVEVSLHSPRGGAFDDSPCSPHTAQDVISDPPMETDVCETEPANEAISPESIAEPPSEVSVAVPIPTLHLAQVRALASTAVDSTQHSTPSKPSDPTASGRPSVVLLDSTPNPHDSPRTYDVVVLTPNQPRRDASEGDTELLAQSEGEDSVRSSPRRSARGAPTSPFGTATVSVPSDAKPFLGLSLMELHGNMGSRVLVHKVHVGGPAHVAGITANTEVTAINDARVNSVQQARDLVRLHTVIGTPIKFECEINPQEGGTEGERWDSANISAATTPFSSVVNTPRKFTTEVVPLTTDKRLAGTPLYFPESLSARGLSGMGFGRHK